MTIDLTIIIPHFNTPQYLRTLLESIPTYENIRVIVIDDRSDKNLDEYESLKNDVCYKHVLFLENTSENKGAGACRNIGLQHATGKWVLFADADDFFVEGFYDKIKDYITSYYDVVFFIPKGVDRDTMKPAYRHLNYIDILKNYSNSPSIKHELALRYFMTSPWSKLIKRELISKNHIRFDEVLVSNDIAFSTKVGYHMETFIISNETIYCVTNSKGTLTKALSEANYDTRLSVFIWRYNFLKKHLTKKEFSKLDMLEFNKGFQFVTLIKYNLGFKKLLSVIRLLRENNVRIFSWKYLNPLFIIKSIKLVVRDMTAHRANKRFYTK